MAKEKRMVVSMGHGGADGGSYGYDKKWERDRIRELSRDLKKSLPQITYRDEKNSNGKWKYSNRYGYDKSASIHFNAFDKKAYGVEVWYKKSSEKAHAERLSRDLSKAMGIKNRGAKKDTRGLYMMNIGFDFLVEICFHDNKTDLEKYKKNYNKMLSVFVNDFSDLIGIKAPEIAQEFDPECYERVEPEPRWLPKVVIGKGENEDDSTNILRLQKFFNWLEHDQKITKKVDTETISNIKKFQKAYGLEVDGYFGNASRNKAKTVKNPKKLYEIHTNPKRLLPTEEVGVGYGNETNVLRVQKFLNWYGIKVCTSKKYDDDTVKAVKQFQEENDLSADGSFGNKTKSVAGTIRR